MKIMKLLLCLFVVTSTNAVAMEFENDYPFNIKHTFSWASCATVPVKALAAGAASFTAVLGLEVGALHYHRAINKWIGSLSDAEVLSAPIVVGLSSASYVAYTRGATWLKSYKLFNYLDNQSFLDIIQSNNENHARAWLQLCYKDHAIAVDLKGKTALIHAAHYGSEKVARILLDAGADVNAQDSQKKTALMYAVERNDQAMMSLLQAYGAQ